MRYIPHSAATFVPASHENPVAPGVLKKVLATKHQLQDGHVQMINWSLLPVGSSFRPHYHEDMQEVFIMVSGDAEMTVAEEVVPLQTGDMMIVEPREVHTMRNTGSTDVVYIVLGISSEQGGQTIVVPDSP